MTRERARAGARPGLCRLTTAVQPEEPEPRLQEVVLVPEAVEGRGPGRVHGRLAGALDQVERRPGSEVAHQLAEPAAAAGFGDARLADDRRAGGVPARGAAPAVEVDLRFEEADEDRVCG